jgi:hypothetical protein
LEKKKKKLTNLSRLPKVLPNLALVVFLLSIAVQVFLLVGLQGEVPVGKTRDVFITMRFSKRKNEDESLGGSLVTSCCSCCANKGSQMLDLGLCCPTLKVLVYHD